MISMRPLFEKYGIYLFLAVLIIVASVATPAFLNPSNLREILNQLAPLGIVAIGQTLVLLSGGGGIDLSVASVMATSAVIVSKMTHGNDALFPLVAPVCLLFGILVGLTNGLLITKRRVPPVLATLGTLLFVQGLRYVYTGGISSGDIPAFARVLGRGTLWLIPVPILSLLILVAAAAIMLNKTVLGRQIYAIGGNREAAKLSGYRVDLIIPLVYMISGYTAAIGGIYLAGWAGYVDNMVGAGYEIDSIAVVVMGGTSFEGGRGGVFGTIAGVFIVMIMYNLVLLLHLPVDFQLIIKGAVIITAAAFYVRKVQR